MDIYHVLLFIVYLEVSMVTEIIRGHHGGTHYCPSKYYVKVQAYVRYYTSCGWWGRGRCARSRRIYKTESRTNHKSCCSGYTGTSCNIPICNPSCKTNGVCIAPNDCYCRPGSTGSTCSLALCSESNDCYPGTCHDRTKDCICAAGFTGSSCSEMEYAGTFASCNTELFTSNQLEAAFSGICGVRDDNGAHSNDHSYFSNIKSLTRMSFDYEAIYQDQPDLPPIPSEYMVQARFGLTDSYITTTMTKQDGTVVWENLKTSCQAKVAEGQSPAGEKNPHASLHCRDITQSRPYTIEEKDKLEVEVTIKSGGFKETKNPSTNVRQNRTYIGSTLSQYMDVTFDIEPPFHCEENENCQDEDQVPCGWMPDLAVQRNLTVRWFGWNDTGSGIKEYRYTIYAMELDNNGLLIDGDTPVREEKIWESGQETPRFFFDVPGMYSMILEVVDHAGNSKKARSVMLFDHTHKLETVEENPILVIGLQKWDDAFWMNTDGHQLIVTWENRFIHRFHMDNGLLNEVDRRSDLIDDDTGNRTIRAVDNVQGVVRFEWTYNKGQANALSTTPENDWIDGGLSLNTEITETLVDGQSIVFFVRAYDAVGNSMMESISIHIDTSPALYEENKSSFERDVDNLPDDLDYGSRYVASAVDTNSGIRAIEYNLTDITSSEEVIVVNGTSEGQRHPTYQTSDQCISSGECYCVPLGPCYTNLQNVWINNCDLADRDGHQFRLDFSIVNGAGSRTEQSRNLGILQGLRGIGFYPPPQEFRSLNAGEFGTKMTMAWYYTAACYQIHSVRLELTDGDIQRAVEISGDRKTYELTDLSPNTAYTVDITVLYIGGQRSETQTLQFSTGDITAEEEGGGGLGVGGIIGIVIALVIIILLVVLILAVVFCRKRGPAPVRRMTQRVANRLSRFHPGQHSDPEVDFNNLRHQKAQNQRTDLLPNPSYAQNTYCEATGDIGNTGPNKALNVAYKTDGDEEDDVYIYGSMETSPDAHWKKSSDKIVLGERLPNLSRKGFADLKKATLHDKNGKTTVVAKMCKANASQEDILLMKAKMNFMATDVPPHANIVQFIGAIPPPQGPIILLELCSEGKLLDWLKKQTITDDVLDSMINFTINIAAGMAHLHANKIVHKRLGARNILLTEIRPGQLVAKVSGFGPMPSEQDDDDAKEKIPIKWMAPEQFDKPRGQKRVYTQATDVWSYGVVCQEIFSKGGALYKDMTVPQLKDAVKNGYKMPMPEYCPPFISETIMLHCWDLKPNNRLCFQNILTKLKKEYESRGSSEDYVYDEGEQMYQNNTVPRA